MTIQLAYRDKGKAEAELRYEWSTAYFLDTREKKKYQILKDSQGVFLAAPDDGFHRINTKFRRGKLIVWFKFPAPPAGTTKINLVGTRRLTF